MAYPGRCLSCGRDARVAARSLCERCYRVVSRSGHLDEWPTQAQRTSALLDDWQWLATTGETVTSAAHRLGMSPAALDRALHRALARGDRRGTHSGGCEAAKRASRDRPEAMAS